MLDGSLCAPGCPGGLHVSPVGSLGFCNWRTGLTIFEVGGAAPDARGVWGIVNGIPCWGSHRFPLEYELLEDRSQAGVSFAVPTSQAHCWCGQEGGQKALAWPLLQRQLYLCCPGLTTGLPGWPLSGWLKEGRAWSCTVTAVTPVAGWAKHQISVHLSPDDAILERKAWSLMEFVGILRIWNPYTYFCLWIGCLMTI